MQLLERHFGAAISEAGRQHVDVAKQHADVVIACLNAIIAYADWAPVPELARYGILSGYGFIDTLAEIVILALAMHFFLTDDVLANS